jgi:hypothetical protein
LIFDSARKLPLNCKYPNVSDDDFNQFQQTKAVPSKPIVQLDAKSLRRQQVKEAKSVIPTADPVAVKITKRAVSDAVSSAKKNKPSVGHAVIHDVHDQRDETIAALMLQVQLLTDSIKQNQSSVSSGLQAQQQNTNFGNVFVPPNTNSFPQFFSSQTPQQQPQRSQFGTAGNIYNDEDAMFSFMFQQQQSNQQAQMNSLQFQNFLLTRRLNNK